MPSGGGAGSGGVTGRKGCLFVSRSKVSHLLAPTRSSVAARVLLISPTPPLPVSPAQSVIRLPRQRSAYGRQRSDHYGLRDPESEGHDFFFLLLLFLSLSPLAPSFHLHLSFCKHRKWEHLEVRLTLLCRGTGSLAELLGDRFMPPRKHE